MKTKLLLAALVRSCSAAAFAAAPDDGSVLPFPPTPLSRQRRHADACRIHHEMAREPERLPKARRTS
jgi:hypothetical protein